ncbi:tetratricopeptide repeat protein [Ahrensia marina]|uniref:tetratricopeptide repeat protein n=1 Tax=Ahrensia marina TaxID=1514904 RepID=UPI0035D004A4
MLTSNALHRLRTYRVNVASRLSVLALGLALGFGAAGAVAPGAAHAQTSPADAWIDDPRAAFAAGTSAYYSGDVQTALQALEAAAEGGHAVARWKLARMYAAGDGVAEDDARAFTYFSQIANAHAEDRPDTPRARFVANAFVAIAGYYNSGIGGVLSPDHTRSRQIFSYAASYFGDPDAQYHLGMMLLHGEGGAVDVRQAGRWLRLSALKGHVDAQLALGELLYAGADGMRASPADGLKWLLIAGEFALTSDEDQHVRTVQERYFAIANTDLRARALQMAEEWLTSPDGLAVLHARRAEEVATQ